MFKNTKCVFHGLIALLRDKNHLYIVGFDILVWQYHYFSWELVPSSAFSITILMAVVDQVH